MTLKERVEIELKTQKRSLSWLAGQMDKSVDGLRLGLVRESIKYGDVLKVCRVLGIRAGVLFGEEPPGAVEIPRVSLDDHVDKQDVEMIGLLKAQLKDKERIIELLSR